VIEIILAIVAIVGCLVFAIAALRMSRTPETAKAKRKKSKKAKTRKKEKRSKSEKEIPASWRMGKKDNPTRSPRFKVPQTRKIRVPGLRIAWRILIGLLLIANFFISQATLMSAPATQPMFWLFFLNTVCLLWALWKTRRKETI